MAGPERWHVQARWTPRVANFITILDGRGEEKLHLMNVNFYCSFCLCCDNYEWNKSVQKDLRDGFLWI